MCQLQSSNTFTKKLHNFSCQLHSTSSQSSPNQHRLPLSTMTSVSIDRLSEPTKVYRTVVVSSTPHPGLFHTKKHSQFLFFYTFSTTSLRRTNWLSILNKTASRMTAKELPEPQPQIYTEVQVYVIYTYESFFRKDLPSPQQLPAFSDIQKLIFR